jgi:hypothetical protein
LFFSSRFRPERKKVTKVTVTSLSFKTTYRLQTTGREYTYEAHWIDLPTGEIDILHLAFDAASAEWFMPNSK